MTGPAAEIRGGENVSWDEVRPGEPVPGAGSDPGEDETSRAYF
jgi:hypothetical protein